MPMAEVIKTLRIKTNPINTIIITPNIGLALSRTTAKPLANIKAKVNNKTKPNIFRKFESGATNCFISNFCSNNLNFTKLLTAFRILRRKCQKH